MRNKNPEKLDVDPGYSKRYRAKNDLVQFNCSIKRSIKRRLDAILEKESITSAQFLTASVLELEANGSPLFLHT